MSWADLSSDHLREITDPAVARSLYKRTVKLTEIEVFSFCNRRCWFCPNSAGDRIGPSVLMAPALYGSIIDQLASIDYAGVVSYSRYNEPFSDRVILERLREARGKLPHATLHTNSNGDYLDRPYLVEAYAAGLRSLNLQIYLQNQQHWEDELVKNRAQQMLKRLGLPHTLVRDEPGNWLEYKLEFEDMSLRLYARNFDRNGTSRGDTVDIRRDHVRTSPCLVPFWAVYIDHNGKMVPCCNFRSDIAAHAPYVSHDLNLSSDLFLAFTNRFISRFRRAMLTPRAKGGLCRSCTFLEEEVTDERTALMARLLAETTTH